MTNRLKDGESKSMLGKSKDIVRSELTDFCRRLGAKPADLFGREMSTTIDYIANENLSLASLRFAARKAALVALAKNKDFDLTKVEQGLKKIERKAPEQGKRLRQEVYAEIAKLQGDFLSDSRSTTNEPKNFTELATKALNVYENMGLTLSTAEKKKVLEGIKTLQANGVMVNIPFRVLEDSLALISKRDAVATNSFLERLAKHDPSIALAQVYLIYNRSNPSEKVTQPQFANAVNIAKTRGYDTAKKHLFIRQGKEDNAEEIARAALKTYCFDYGVKFDKGKEQEILGKAFAEQVKPGSKLGIESSVFKYAFIATLQSGNTDMANEAIYEFGQKNPIAAIDIVADATLVLFGNSIKTRDVDTWQKTLTKAKDIAGRDILAGLVYFRNTISEAGIMLSSLDNVERRVKAAA